MLGTADKGVGYGNQAANVRLHGAGVDAGGSLDVGRNRHRLGHDPPAEGSAAVSAWCMMHYRFIMMTADHAMPGIRQLRPCRSVNVGTKPVDPGYSRVRRVLLRATGEQL